MLELKRRPGQVIVIGENVRVKILGVDADGINVGIDAPRAIPVDREEVREKKRGIHPSQKHLRRKAGL